MNKSQVRKLSRPVSSSAFFAVCLSKLFLCRTLLAFLFSSWIASGAEAVRCFCDARSCDDALCQGNWCLVGFESDVRLVQKCGTYTAHSLKDCRLNWNGWEEVCSCQDDFCNTFSYLRTKTKPLRERKETATFTRIDSADDDTSFSQSDDSSDPRTRSKFPPAGGKNQLIILLVVIPLGVGAMAVCLVFVNYHCKMC